MSLRGILQAEYKILYGINVESQAADDHDDLKQCLTSVWAELKQGVVDKAIENGGELAFSQRANTLNSC